MAFSSIRCTDAGLRLQAVASGDLIWGTWLIMDCDQATFQVDRSMEGYKYG